MDRPPHDYAAAMAFAQHHHPPANLQQQQFGFPPQHQAFPPFLPPQQQFPYHRPPQLHPHAPPPHLLHLQQQQQHHSTPTPPFPPHVPPHLAASPFHGPYDSPPPPAPPPHDPDLLKRIDKLIEYAVKNGPEFEAMIREKQQDNPAYGFLFGGEGHHYYRFKLWMSARPPGGAFNFPFPPSSMQMMHPPNPMMSPSPLTAPQYNASPASVLGPPHLHQPTFTPSYDQQHPQSFGRPDYDNNSYRSYKGLSRPLPPDIEMELNNVLSNLAGTKESIKGAKNWFMQRSPLIHTLAEALRDRVLSLDDSERQLHIIYLANDILFDSLQRRINPHELDNEALAFKPVLASMLARVYHNPQNKEENQSRLQKIVQFWGSKEVFDQETIHAFENEMTGGPPPNSFGVPQRDSSTLAPDLSAVTGGTDQSAVQWKPDVQSPLLSLQDQDKHAPHIPPMATQQYHATPVPLAFPSSIPLPSSLPPSVLPPPNIPPNVGEKLPTYPLFPPGLIPGMVRKMQIGSGVPYSPLSPLDIPTVIPPSTISQSEILERVSKFFREIDEVNPSEGPMNPSDGYDDYEREPPTRKGGACIPPPPDLQNLDVLSLEPEPNRSARPGLGAEPDEASQYGDVYSSYRNERSTNYHSSMSAKAPSIR
ncbi:unnamed protein product [Cuscuta europaea]|nr:unnamed protein product [Cuscuta europaea]